MGKKDLKKSSSLGALIGFINGLFGSGGGALLVPFLERMLKVEEHKAHATAIATILPLSIMSSLVYIKHDVIEWDVLLYVSLGGIVGGIIGAKLLNKISAKWLHRIFGAFLIVASIRMIIP